MTKLLLDKGDPALYRVDYFTRVFDLGNYFCAGLRLLGVLPWLILGVLSVTAIVYKLDRLVILTAKAYVQVQ